MDRLDTCQTDGSISEAARHPKSLTRRQLRRSARKSKFWRLGTPELKVLGWVESNGLHGDQSLAEIYGSKLKRNRVRGLPFVLGHEVKVSLSRPLVQVANERRDLVQGLSLSNQNRDKRVPQGVVS